MISYSADMMFDGFHFMPEGSSVEVNESGKVISLNNGKDYERRHLKGLLMPGMVNAHCHLELSHLKGKIPRHTGLIPFLQQVVSERGKTEEDQVQQSIREAEKEMWDNGIVAVGDICNTHHTEQIKKSSRIRYHSFIELIGLNPEKAEVIVDEGVLLKEKFKPSSLGLHAPYSITPELIRLVDEKNKNRVITIHHQESQEETKLFRHEPSEFIPFLEKITGKKYSHRFPPISSSQAVIGMLQFSSPLILVHNTFTSEQDLDYLSYHPQPVYLCACAGANSYIENRVPDIRTWLSKRLPLVLGTDSLASNNELNIIHEVMILHHHFPDVNIGVWLRASTLDGANALRMQEELGSLEKGKTPGIIQIENWDDLVKGHNRCAQIVRHA